MLKRIRLTFSKELAVQLSTSNSYQESYSPLSIQEALHYPTSEDHPQYAVEDLSRGARCCRGNQNRFLLLRYLYDGLRRYHLVVMEFRRKGMKGRWGFGRENHGKILNKVENEFVEEQVEKDITLERNKCHSLFLGRCSSQEYFEVKRFSWWFHNVTNGNQKRLFCFRCEQRWWEQYGQSRKNGK